ncbi:MAG TPA: hypothetical protein VHP83_26030 [Aggregatilineaceae bacterium]|nr:hypothetical protein [Aggregatilineaceae bacterium]
MAGTSPSFIEAELRTTDTRRHWSPTSQVYAPVDVLVQYISDGWTISPVVGLEEHWHAGVRRVDVYHFELMKDEQVQVLPVQSNPIVRRLLQQHHLKVVLLRRDNVKVPGEAQV